MFPESNDPYLLITDFGVDDLLEFKNATTFPWLLSNVIDDFTGDFLADGKEKLLIDWHGHKVSS